VFDNLIPTVMWLGGGDGTAYHKHQTLELVLGLG